MKDKTVCFTGHRKIPPEHFDEISQRLESAIIQLIKQGYISFISGGALGFDTLAAQTVLKFKQMYPEIKITLALPCETQAKQWSKEEQAIYESIKDNSDEVVYTSKTYYRGCMHKRNRYLIDNSNACICYLTKETGGTAYTVTYAKRKGLKIYNLA